MARFLDISNTTLFLYYLASNVIYLFLLVVALTTSLAHHRRLSSIRLVRVKDSPFTKPITLLVPAHNEEKSIIASARSLLALEYPELEVIIINDGSADGTLGALQEHFALRLANLLYLAEIPTAPVRAVYISSREPRLVVVDKEPGGSKADALNAGLNAASSPYVCVVDADSILEPDALLRIMVQILSDPKHIVASGGIVRVVNGSRVEGGRLRRVRLPRGSFEVLQVIEYLRAFLIGREAWARFNLLPLISGAFGVFRQEVVKAVGGFRASAIGEDFDLVARMHRHLMDAGGKYRIAFVPDPVCWTEVPADVRSLGRQRARWQEGLIDVLWLNRDMLFRRRYGLFGAVALPYLWVFEFFAPFIELTGYSTIFIALVLGRLSHAFFAEFLIFGYLFAAMISVGAVLQEEVTYRRYNDWKDVARLIVYCFLEQIPYRQLQLYWRLQGTWQYFRGDVSWRPMKRVGFQTTD